LLKANNVGRSKPTILAGPRLRCVFAAIFLGDRPLSEEIVVILLLFAVHDHALWVIASVKRGRKKKEKKK
jgi:hypothetical protein